MEDGERDEAPERHGAPEDGPYDPPEAPLTPPDGTGLGPLGPERKDSPLRGFLLGLAALIAVELVFIAWMNVPGAEGSIIPVFAFFIPGAVIWLVVIPLAIVLGRRGYARTVRGLLVTSGVIALLNATCCGLLFNQL